MTDNLGASTTSTPVAVNVTAHIPKAYDIQSDHLNTPRMITDSTGAVVWQWDSDPFGATVPNENPGNTGSANNFVFNPRFPGQYFDRETGLHYNYFRDYDPQLGSYVESDPIGLDGGINTYAYVEGDPLTYSDPLGLAGQPKGIPSVSEILDPLTKGGPKGLGKYIADLLAKSGYSREAYKCANAIGCSGRQPDDVLTKCTENVLGSSAISGAEKGGAIGSCMKMCQKIIQERCEKEKPTSCQKN